MIFFLNSTVWLSIDQISWGPRETCVWMEYSTKPFIFALSDCPHCLWVATSSETGCSRGKPSRYVFESWMQSYVFRFERKYVYARTYSSAASVITGQCAVFASRDWRDSKRAGSSCVKAEGMVRRLYRTRFWDPETTNENVRLSARTIRKSRLERQNRERAVDAGNVLLKYVYKSLGRFLL